VSTVPDRRRLLGWLAVPAFLLVLGLVGMGVSVEDRQNFEDRNQQSADRPDQGGGGDQRSEQRGSPTDDGEPRPADRSGGEPTDQQGSDGGRTRITIGTDGDTVVVEVDGDGRPVRLVPGDAPSPIETDRSFSPDPDGDLIGVRISESGTLEPVRPGDLQTDDYLLRPDPGGGLDITRPDGTRLRITPDAEGLQAEEIDVDGNVGPATTDGESIVVQPASDLDPAQPIDPDAEPMIIETGEGPIGLELDPDGGLVARDPTADGSVVLDPDEASAIRIGEDGELEVVPLDEVSPDDTVLVPTGNGFDLVRPDGSRVEFRADGEHDGITATEVAPDGTETELVPNQDGTVTLDDGTTVGPIDAAEDGGPIERLLDTTSELPWPWVFGGLALLALLSIGTAVYLHKNRPDDPFDLSQFAIAGIPTDRFEEFLTMLGSDPDRSRAVRLSFYAAERGLGGAPRRRVEETPFEWQRRVEELRPELGRLLAPICDLFARARFAPGQATADDLAAMIAALRELNRAGDPAAASVGTAGRGAEPMGV
jgi:hypothetical protein